MTQQRLEKPPQNPEENIRIKPGFFHPRRYYLKKLRDLIIFARDQYILPVAIQKNIKLTDYGCGTKPYLSLFTNSTIKYLGIDLPWNPYADVHIHNNKIDLPDNEVDVVLSTQVLEHVEDYKAYLKEAQRILKEEGILILTTHGYWMYHPDPTDFWRWTSAGLKKIVTEAGFEVIAFKGILSRASMGMQLFQDGFLFKIPKFLRPLWAAWMQIWIGFSDKFSSQQARDQDACTYLVVAKKINTPH